MEKSSNLTVGKVSARFFLKVGHFFKITITLGNYFSTFSKLLTKDHFTKNQDKRRAFSTKVTFLLAFLQEADPYFQLKKVKLMNGTETALRVVCLPLKVFAELQRMTNMGMTRGQSQYISKYRKKPQTTVKLPSDYR